MASIGRYTLLGNLKGVQGVKGNDGSQGLPGTGGAAVSDTVAAWIAADGTTSANAVDGRITKIAADSYLQNIVCFGDSLTEGNQDLSGNTFPSLLAAALARTGAQVVNLGKSGWTSTEVAARQGGASFTVGAFTLPAGTGPTTVTISSPTDAFRVGTINVFPSWAGTLIVSGTPIPGRLRHTIDSGAAVVNAWTFERTTAGTSLSVPAGSVFATTEFDAYRNWTQILMVGRNNISDASIVARDVASMVNYMTKTTKKYLVLSVTTTSSETSGTSGYNAVAAINSSLSSTYGSRYLDVRGYLIASGLSVNGMTATTADTAAIAADTIPPSLLMPDGVHPNRLGYRAISTAILARLQELATAAAVSVSLPSPAHRWSVEDLAWAETGNVASWTASHGGIPLVQATASLQPKMTTVSTLRYVRFDGIDDFLDATSVSIAQPVTIFVRARVRSLAIKQGLAWSPSGSNNITMTAETTGALRGAATTSMATAASQVVVDTSQVFVGVFDSTRSSVRVNNGTPGTGDIGAGILSGFRTGYAYDGAARYASTDVREIRVYPYELKPVEIAQVIANMN